VLSAEILNSLHFGGNLSHKVSQAWAEYAEYNEVLTSDGT